MHIHMLFTSMASRRLMDFLPTHSILLLLSWSFSSLLCASQNHLAPGKPLYAGSTLVSDNGAFALGFFPTSNSTKKHYHVGIWYNNIPQLTVVWVANRDIPVLDTTSAKLTLSSDSNLVLSNTGGSVLWTTNTSAITSPSTRANATLDNTGNFILQSSVDGMVLWQSFDHPTDTLIPGMKFRISHGTHGLEQLIPWKDPQDPSPGSFSYGADPNSIFQRFIWNGSRPYRRLPIWPSWGDLEIIKSSLYMTVQRNDDDIYMSFRRMSSSSTPVILKIDYSGMLKLLAWDSSKWITLMTEPAYQCSTYGYCGPSGYCDNTEHMPTCKCLDGFEPNNKEEWASGKFSQGCIRKELIRCGHGDSFLTLTGMKVPDKFLYVKNTSFDECVAECSRNCSCVAYAYANMSTRAINGDDTRCLVWMGEMIDTEKPSVTDQQIQDLYVRHNGLSRSKRKSKVLQIALIVPASLLTLMCICLVWIHSCRAKQRRNKLWEIRMQGDLSISNELGDGKLEFPFLKFEKIAVATNNFADSNMLGRGGFGNVYKGVLEDGTEIAAKRLSKSSGQGVAEFRNEVILIAKLQHRNLVKLLGCCIHEDEKLLIYEYLPNKSLDACIFTDDARKHLLDWPTRFKIIQGVARGLLYLHQDSRLTIIHRDLKASNILLDADMSPKISDFGMARIFGSDQHHENTNRVVGTYGYMSPEYALEGAFSVKSDVYSFGVLLLEIVSGIKISSKHQLFTNFPNLKAYAWSIWNNGNTKDLVDSLIQESCSFIEVSQCVHVGLLCVQDDPNDRPPMSSVVFILENGATALPAPKQPIYYSQRNHGSNEVGGHIENSVNYVSLTALEGR